MEKSHDLKPEEIQSLASFHATMAEQLNSRLSESHRFFGVLVLALTAYGYVIWGWKPETGRFLLALVSVISYLVVFWALWYLAALGYAFRFLQFSMHQTETALGWRNYGLDSGQVAKGLFRWCWLLPGIYHAHLFGLLVVMVIVCSVFALKWWHTLGAFGHSYFEAIASSVIGVVAAGVWAVLINLHYVNKYEAKAGRRTTMNDKPVENSSLHEARKTQLTELNNRSRWYAGQVWQLPIAYVGATGIALAQLAGESSTKRLGLALIACGIVGGLVLWHSVGIFNGVKRAVQNLIRVERELGLVETAQWRPWTLIPLLIAVGLVSISYVGAGLYWVFRE